MENIQNNLSPINTDKLRKTAKVCLIIVTILFVLDIPLAFVYIGFALLGLAVSQIELAITVSLASFIFLILSWVVYRGGEYKASLYLLIIPLVYSILIILLPLILIFSTGVPDSSALATSQITPIDTTNTGSEDSIKTNVVTPVVSSQPATNSTTHQFGIMTVTSGGNTTINKAVVAAVSQDSNSAVTPQTTTNFSKGTNYVMYFSGVNGFTENHPYGAPAGFVDAKGSIVLYDGNNKIIFNEPDIFSSYVGGVPSNDFSYLTFKLNLSANFKAGTYRWESMVTDNKDSSNYLKGVVNFTVN